MLINLGFISRALEKNPQKKVLEKTWSLNQRGQNHPQLLAAIS